MLVSIVSNVCTSMNKKNVLIKKKKEKFLEW